MCSGEVEKTEASCWCPCHAVQQFNRSNLQKAELSVVGAGDSVSLRLVVSVSGLVRHAVERVTRVAAWRWLSGDPQERLWERHGQAEGGGVLEQYMTVQRLYPNQGMRCTGRSGRVRLWGGGAMLGRQLAQIITHAHPIDLPGW